MLVSYVRDAQGQLSQSDGLVPIDASAGNRYWFQLTKPTSDELKQVVAQTGVPIRALEHALDPNQISTVEHMGDLDNGGYAALIVDVPVTESFSRGGHTSALYQTYPLGIVLFHDGVVTVSLKETDVLHSFTQDTKRIAELLGKRSLFLLEVLLCLANQCVDILDEMNKVSKDLEEKLYSSLDNEQLIKLLMISRSFIFLKTSITSNAEVVHELEMLHFMSKYDDDNAIITEVLLETKQALEMINIYTAVLKESVEVCASIIANNQNKVMKFLAAIMLITAVPTIVGGLFGMNVTGIPLANHPLAFWLIIGACFATAGGVGYIMRKRGIM